MSRTKSNSKSPSDITLATFRLRQGLWDQFKSLCDANKTNATETLIAFIEQAVEASSLGAIAPQTNTTTNIHDIDDRIRTSFEDGGVAYEVIYKVKQDLMNVINDLNGRVQALEQPQLTPPQPTQPETEPETTPETKPEPTPEPEVQPQLQPSPDVQPTPPSQLQLELQPETKPEPEPEPEPEPTPETELTLPQQSEIDKQCLSPLLKKKPGLRNLLIKVGFLEILNSSRQPGGFILSLQYAKDSNLLSNLLANYSSLQKYLNVELKENSLVPISKILRDCGYIVSREGKNYIIKHYLA